MPNLVGTLRYRINRLAINYPLRLTSARKNPVPKVILEVKRIDLAYISVSYQPTLLSLYLMLTLGLKSAR